MFVSLDQKCSVWKLGVEIWPALSKCNQSFVQNDWSSILKILIIIAIAIEKVDFDWSVKFA